MSTLLPGPPDLDVDMVTTLDIGPRGLDRFLDLVAGDRPLPRITYQRGNLTLVSPSRKHERSADRLDGVVKAIGAELDIPYQATGATLFRRRDLDSGIEADRTYYLAHEPAVRDLPGDIDRDTSPPPDLAIDVVVTHSPAKALSVCRDLGIPEVWIYWANRGVLEFLDLDEARGDYVVVPMSRAFPFLTPADVQPWIVAAGNEPDNRWDRRLRQWVRDVLGPRLI